MQLLELSQVCKKYYHNHWCDEKLTGYQQDSVQSAGNGTCMCKLRCSTYLGNLLTNYILSPEIQSTGQLIIHQSIPNMVIILIWLSKMRLWNNLGQNLRLIVSPQIFKCNLKHYNIELSTVLYLRRYYLSQHVHVAERLISYGTNKLIHVIYTIL